MKVIALSLVAFCSCFALIQADISDLTPIHKKGYCIWYDQCIRSGDVALNCVYNGPAKTLNDSKGIEILNKLCPKFADRRTCCSTKQLETFDKDLNTLRQLSSRCPSCWQNMLDLYCELTCSPDQSMFMDPTDVIGFGPYKSIDKVNYYVSMDFKNGLFDSCKDVTFPGSGYKILNFLCGKNCTPQKLVEYMGSTASGRSPFDISYPQIIPMNMTWMNDNSFSCNISFVNPWTNKTFSNCSCQDCSSSCHGKPHNITKDPYDSPLYRKAKLIITANPNYPQNHTGFYRYPDGKFIPFGHIFHLDLLNQALDLQLALTAMKIPYTKNNKTINITLQDVCFKSPPPGNNKCVIQSLFQYFQNNNTRLNYCLSALGHECTPGMIDYVKAEYHSHVLFCTSFPPAVHDRKWGGGSCLGEDGLPANPDFILGFNYTDYNLANYLVISFVFKNHTEETKNAMAEAWEKAFLSYMKKYVQDPKHSNLTIRFSAEGLVVHDITTPSTLPSTAPSTSPSTLPSSSPSTSPSTDRNSGCSAEATTFRLLTGVIGFIVLLSRISF